MSDQLAFDLIFGAAYVLMGVMWLVRAYRGVLPRPEFISLFKNSIAPESMTPRMQMRTKIIGFGYVCIGLFFLVLTVRRLFLGR